jgi:pimeloyl-ACP methyl ester carboxylesterase
MAQDTNAAEEYAEAARQLGAAATGVADLVQRVHQTLAARPFNALGAAAEPARKLHDGVSEVVYESIRAGLRAGGSLATAAAGAAGMTRQPGSLLDSPVGRAAAGILGGAFGERVQLAPPELTVRVDGKTVEVNRAVLARAFPDASDHVVLFLHGLIETERWWYPRPGGADEPVRVDFGTRLAEDIGCTPVYLRYHSGRHVSANGRELAELLGRLVDVWPVPVQQLSIVGHSMGGLVARSALHQGVQSGQPWTARLTHLICLGTPHTGAPLELGAHLLSWALRKLPDTAPLGELLELRSDGIKDLRHGYLHDEEWADADPDELIRRAKRPLALVPKGTRQHFFTATLARSPQSLLGRLLGDTLVTPNSSGDGTQEAVRHVAGGLHHFALLHHDDVYLRIRDWLTSDSLPTTVRARRLRDRLRRRPA